MIWYILAGAVLLLFLHYWRNYNHPLMILTRQAANMNWVASGTAIDGDGIRNTKVSRNGVVAVIMHTNRNVELLNPSAHKSFKDFIELERYLAKIEDEDEDEDEDDSFNNFYFEVESFLSQSPHYEDFILPAQCFKEFLDASYAFCKAGYKADKSPRVIGALIAEAASRSTKSIDYGVIFLEAGTTKIIRDSQAAQG